MLKRPTARLLLADVVTLATVLALVPLLVPRVVGAQAAAPHAITVSVFASGLNSPRGLKFDRDGYLYVAEGGTGGSNPEDLHGTCPVPPQCLSLYMAEVPPCSSIPVAGPGPYTGSPTGGRISKISPTGARSTVTDTLPSSQSAPRAGSAVSGVADVAFVGNTLYGLLAGAGIAHAVPQLDNGVVRVDRIDGSWRMTADLSQFLMTHPVANPNCFDFEPDGTWWNMVAVNGKLYATEPNHGELDQITLGGNQISRVADISASQGHIVPTALAYHDGTFYVGNLGTFVPQVVAGSSKILKITPGGQVTTAFTGFTNVLGVTFDAEGRLYVLEMNTVGGNPGPVPFTGDIVRVAPDGSKTVITSGLAFPTGMTFGPDGALYISNFGFGFPAGAGQILRVTLP